LNPRPPGYEPGELPDCSTPRRVLKTPCTRTDTLTDPGTVRQLRFWPAPHCRPPPRAGNGTRTRDPNLGKVVLYQLSYSREADDFSVLPVSAQRPGSGCESRSKRGHGGEGDRTPDLVNAIHALSQLSYAPAGFSRLRTAPLEPTNLAVAGLSVNDSHAVCARANLFLSSIIRVS
jgi:hypothetical protein